MLKSVKIGVAGAGVFGAYHAAKFAALSDADFIGVFDIDFSRAKALASQHDADAFSEYAGLLDKVDAVAVTAPAICHFELAEKALQRGCHVFVEKPLALSLADADALIKLAEEKNLVLQIGHQERYVFAAAGLFNRQTALLKIDCVRCGPASGRCEDVSTVFDLMIHDLDLVRQLTNSELASVDAVGEPNSVSAELTLKTGTIATFKADRCSSNSDRRMTLVYEDGVIEFDFVNREISNSTGARLNHSFDTENAPLAFTDPLAFGADQFIQSVQAGAQPIVTGQHARAAIEWALMIEAAAGINLRELGAVAERLRA